MELSSVTRVTVVKPGREDGSGKTPAMLLSLSLLPIPSQHSVSHGSQRQLASFRAIVVGPTPGASWPGGRREGWKSAGFSYQPTPLHGPEAMLWKVPPSRS